MPDHYSDIHLHIDELVLHGFERMNSHQIQAAVEQEVARLIAERGMPSGWSENSEVLRADGGSFHVTPQSRPETIGRQVASAVYRCDEQQ